jgi:hypothetical protein
MVSFAEKYPLRAISTRDLAAVCDKMHFVATPDFGRNLGKSNVSRRTIDLIAARTQVGYHKRS